MDLAAGSSENEELGSSTWGCCPYMIKKMAKLHWILSCNYQRRTQPRRVNSTICPDEGKKMLKIVLQNLVDTLNLSVGLRVMG